MSAPDGNLIVVAGAGTGKTYKLVQTCIRRIREGAGIDEVLIVTFTKAAAAELRNRIGTALRAAADKEPDSLHLARQLALLDRAQISTLHGFCLELVSRHFSELGLSPRLTTLEAAQAGVLEHEALEGLFETYYEAKTDRAKVAKKLLLEWFKGDDAQARAIIRKLNAFTQALPNPGKWFAEQKAILSEREPALWRERYGDLVGDWANRWRLLIEQQAVEKNPARALVLEALRKLDVGTVAAIGNIKDDKSVWPHGSKVKYKAPVEKLYEEASALASWMKTEERDPLKEDWEITRGTVLELIAMTEDFQRDYARLKRERGAVDFNDLEQFSIQLLWDKTQTTPSPVAEFWRARLKWVFVDEYQDINRAQDLIIQALSRPAAQGNRLLVGDVKQSIYAFRQAEPRVFREYHDKWAGGADGLREFLQNNWRSHERILHFINALFTGIMREDRGGVDYDENAALKFGNNGERLHHSAEHDPAHKVEVHLVDRAEESTALENGDDESAGALGDFESAEAEAEMLAALCERMVEREPLILPKGQPATYGDIVILMRSAASEVEAFAKIFGRRGIQLDARRTGFFNCIEVLDLLNLLTILDNPLQDIPLLGVLRSPLGCFSIEDLAETRAALPRGAYWEALQKFVNGGEGVAIGKARAFLARFQKWRKLARHSSLAQRLEIILEESGYEDWAAAQDRGAQRRANVRRLVELARQFDEMQGDGLYAFLQYVEEQTKAVGDLAPASVDSHGAVRIMTVHQSKGLQFPIVIVAGLHKQFNKTDFRASFLLEEEFGPCVKARVPETRREYETLGFWAARRKLEKRMLDEEMRILYVALTRAESRLILSAVAPKKAREQWNQEESRANVRSMLEWIGPWLAGNCPTCLEADRGEANDWIWQWHAPSGAQPARKEISQSAPTFDPEALARLKGRLDWKYPFAAATVQEAKSSATALRRALPDEPELARPLAHSPKGKLKANELGQAAHRFLEHAQLRSLNSERSLRVEIERLRDSAVLSADEAASIEPAKILGFWNSALGKEFLDHAEELHRELIFTAKFTHAELKEVGAPVNEAFGEDEFIVVQGAADLVALLPKEIWLVDFKTDRAPEKQLTERVKEYSLQLRIYAHALSRIYKRPVTRTCLYFLDTGRIEWVERYQPGYLPLI